MGRWGEYLFQGDSDLDEASYISEDAGIELYSFELEPEGSKFECGGKGLEATREHLNKGIFTKLFDKYATTGPDNKEWRIEDDQLRLVLLAALGMRVGVTIAPRQLELLRSIYTKIPVAPKYSLTIFDTGFRGPMRDQFEIALNHYKNDGTPFDFDRVRCAAKGCSKDDSELEDGKKLKKCAKCLEVKYCSKDCQTAHWKVHKKVCKTPEEKRKAEEAMYGGSGFMSLNV